MALIKGKQLQDTSVSLGKLSGAGSVTISGTITTPAASLLINSAPTQATHAVNKEYVDSVATGLDVKKSVRAIFVENIDAQGGTPALVVDNQIGGAQATFQDLFTNITNNTPTAQVVFDGITLQDGDRVLIAGRTIGRRKINGIYVYEAGIFTRAEDADNINPNSEVTGGLFTFVEEGDIFADTGWVLSSPNGVITGLYDYNLTPGGNTELEFTQFSAAGVAEAGVGLTRVGTKFNVNYDNSSIGIDGSDQLYVKANGITNDMIVNEYTTFAGNTGSGNVVLGGTLTIAGGVNGIDTVYSAGTLTINLDLTELTTVQTITDDDFIAISQAVSSGGDNQKIAFGDLKALIGAATELRIGVEGEQSVTFDIDIDSLDFTSGPGLTFSRNVDGSGTEGVAETLTVTLTNNALDVHQSTGLTGASGANTDITIPAAAEVFSVTLNGVSLKKGSTWIWPYNTQNTVVRVTALPYALEASDEIEITYRVY